jgi:hypothetical protein
MNTCATIHYLSLTRPFYKLLMDSLLPCSFNLGVSIVLSQKDLHSSIDPSSRFLEDLRGQTKTEIKICKGDPMYGVVAKNPASVHFTAAQFHSRGERQCVRQAIICDSSCIACGPGLSRTRQPFSMGCLGKQCAINTGVALLCGEWGSPEGWGERRV